MSSDLKMNPVDVIMETLWFPLPVTKSQKLEKQSRSPTPAADGMVAKRQETATTSALCIIGEWKSLWRFRQEVLQSQTPGKDINAQLCPF